MKTICFIRIGPTSPYLGRKIDPHWYQENNFNVLFWDLSKLFFSDKQISLYQVNKNYFFDGPNQTKFQSIKEFLYKIKNLNKDSIIIYFNRNPFLISTIKDKWLIKELSNFKNLGFMQFDTRPKGNNIYERFKDIYRINKNRYLSRQLSPKFFICSGIHGEYWSKNIYPKTKFINVPTPLVDWKVKKNKYFSKYILFVEENFIKQPDAQMYNEIYCNDTKNYHRRMNEFFDFIELNFGKKVIIGASGKFSYDNKIFNGRKIIYNKTLELISNSFLTMGHCSLALYQVVRFNTPLLLVNDKSFTSRQKIENLYAANLFQNSHVDNSERSWKKIVKYTQRSEKLNNKIIHNFFDSKYNYKYVKEYKKEIKNYFDQL